MSWTIEQAANDLERFLLRGEKPAIESVRVAVWAMRNMGGLCHYCDNFTDTAEAENRKFCKLHNHLTQPDKCCSWWKEKTDDQY